MPKNDAWSTGGLTSAGQSIEDVPVAAVPKRKFTALLDADTDARYGRLLDTLRAELGPVATRSDGNGRTRAGYDLSRADLLRALLEVAEGEPGVMRSVGRAARSHYGTT